MRKLTQEFHSFTIDPPKTLRDEFAIAAMQGMIAYDPLRWGGPMAPSIAEQSYVMADAMLKARKS